MQHHAGQGAALTLAPVRPAAWHHLDPAVGMQGQANPVVAAPEGMLPDQLLPEMLDREIPIQGVEQLQHRQHRVHRHPTARRAAQATVMKTFRALGLEAVPPAPESPFRYPQYRRRLRLA